MKKLFVLVALGFMVIAVHGQGQNPVSWNFTTKKIADKTFEVHMTANVQSGWHIYSQTQPDDAIALPTSITVNTNPLVTLNGKIKEVGKMEKYKDPTLGSTAHQYSGKVDFVQVIKLKANAKTNFAGNIEYQTCDDKKCLLKSVNFNIALK